MDYSILWETLLTKLPYKEDYADVLHLVEILLVLPISAAQSERAVSSKNRIKSSNRTTLNVAGSQVVCAERCCSKYHYAIHDLGLVMKVKKECKTMEH